MAMNAKEYVEKLQLRITALEKELHEVTRQAEIDKAHKDIRLDNLEKVVFVLLSSQIDTLAPLVNGTDNGVTLEVAAAAQSTSEMWAEFQALVSPREFVNLYRIDPQTGQSLDDAGVEAYIKKPRIYES